MTVEMQSVGVKGIRVDLFSAIKVVVDVEERDKPSAV